MDDSLDYGANYSHMMGFDDPKMLEFMRLYVTIHRFVLPGICYAHDELYGFLLITTKSFAA